MKRDLRFVIYLCSLGTFLLSSIATHSQSDVEVWVRRYNSVGGSVDYGHKVVVDPDGNVVVVGESDGTTGGGLLIIKYSGAGEPIWTNRYSGFAGYAADATSVGVDQNGNMFVTGTDDNNTNANYITIAVSPAGAPLWTNYYNGPANREDLAQALAVDQNGNVFVTGSSRDSLSSYYYATIAYSNSGVPLWTNRHSGGTFAMANALAVDQGGNVFVTGFSASGYETIAYSAAGMPLWTNRYSGGAAARPNAIGVDRVGNVFVTGQFATIAYSPAGLALWTNRYENTTTGTNSRSDSATALAVDHNDNVFVT